MTRIGREPALCKRSFGASRPSRPAASGFRGAAVAFVILLSRGLAAQWSDDFESYDAGTTLIGQGGWAGWDNSPVPDGDVSSERAFSGTRSLKLRPNSDLVQVLNGINNGQWIVRARVYVPADHAGDTWFILLSEYSHGGPY